MPSRDQELLERLRLRAGPTAVACVNLHNFKALNAVLGYEHGDRIIARVHDALRGLGPCWRTSGDEFIVLLPGPLEAASRALRALSWMFYMRVGVTEGWRFRCDDGRALPPAPRRSFEVVCTPRVALLEVGSDVEGGLEAVRARCDRLREPDSSGGDSGFAPLSRTRWSSEVLLGRPACPACGHEGPARLGAELGWTRERCPQCLIVYERTEVLWVLGDSEAGGYL